MGAETRIFDLSLPGQTVGDDHPAGGDDFSASTSAALYVDHIFRLVCYFRPSGSGSQRSKSRVIFIGPRIAARWKLSSGKSEVLARARRERDDPRLSARSTASSRPKAGDLKVWLARIDQAVLTIFILYAVHVVVAPMDSQVVVEQRAMKILKYGQLVNGSYGQVFFLAFAAVRSAKILSVYRVLREPLGLLAMFAVLSTLWSVQPLTTLHRAFDLVLCVVMPTLFVTTLGFARCLRLSWLVMTAILGISICLALLGSEYALMGGAHLGLWRGVFDHKNAFAPFAATLAVLSFLLPPEVVASRLARYSVGAAAVLAVLGAGSATSMVGLAVAGVAIGLSRFCQRLGLSPLATFGTMTVSILGGGFAALAGAAAALQFLGRSVSLTGRTALWDAAIPITLSRPFGFGYGLNGGEAVLDTVRLQSGLLVAPSLHSGYITMAMDIGWPAAILFTLYLLSKVLILVWREKTADRHMLIAVGLAALNLSLAFTESPFGAYLSAPLIFIVMVGRTKRGFRVQQHVRLKPSSASSATPARTEQRRPQG